VLFQVALDLSSTLMVLLLRDLTMWADHYNGGGPFGVKLCLPSIAGLAVSSYNGVDAQYREAERREAPDASSALDRISRRIGVGKAGSGGGTRTPDPGLRLYREGVEPPGSLRKFQVTLHLHSPFQDFSCRKGGLCRASVRRPTGRAGRGRNHHRGL
jgi:hypothetical protein